MKLTQNGVNLLRTLFNEKGCKLYVLRNLLTCNGKDVKQIPQNTIDALIRNSVLERGTTEYTLTAKAKYFLEKCFI